jgi:flagellar hook-basal body complex protein FliE
MSGVGPLGPIALPELRFEGELRPLGKATATPDAAPFSKVLETMVAGANADALEATRASEAFAAGARDDIHGTMITVKKAEIELKLAANVRNKIVDAFYELWRMNI